MTDFAALVDGLIAATDDFDSLPPDPVMVARTALLTAISALERELESSRTIHLEVELAQAGTNLALKSALAASQAALRKYGGHHAHCRLQHAKFYDYTKGCSCGFTAALSTEGDGHE